MNPPTNQTYDIVSLLMQKDDDAAAALFVDLCRRSKFLHEWLRVVLVPSPDVQAHFFSILRSSADNMPPVTKRDLLALARHGKSPTDTHLEIKRRMLVADGRIYGGLTWSEVEKLVRRYHAGSIDLHAFLLAHDWRQIREGGTGSPRLMRAGLAFLDAALGDHRKRLLKEAAKALDLLNDTSEPRSQRARLGHTSWWKLSVLFYVLNHPKPRYRTHELRVHLASRGVEVENKDIRRFCAQHNIARDTRPGRPPRKRTRSAGT